MGCVYSDVKISYVYWILQNKLGLLNIFKKDDILHVDLDFYYTSNQILWNPVLGSIESKTRLIA